MQFWYESSVRTFLAKTGRLLLAVMFGLTLRDKEMELRGQKETR
jgi:hypothetical protein